MKRSGSTNTFEETIDISSDKDKIKEKQPDSPIVYQKNPLKKSFSEDTVRNFIEEDIPLTPPAKIKSRSRLSSAFRSLRGTKSSSSKKTTDPTEGGLITSGEDIETEHKSDDKDKTKKKTKLSKKFSLNIRKYRVTPKKSSSSSSEHQVQQQQQQQQSSASTLENLNFSQTSTTPQYHHQLSDSSGSNIKNNRNTNNNNLNISQASLIDLPSENETGNDEYDHNDNDYDYDDDDNNNNNNNRRENFQQKEIKNTQQKQNINNHDGVNFIITGSSSKYENNSELKLNKSKIFNEPESPLKFEKVRKIQITIKGKKIERINNNTNRDKLPTTTTSVSGEDDYLTATEVDKTTKRTSSLSPILTGNRNFNLSEQESQPKSISPPTGNKRQSRRKLKSNSKSKDQTQIFVDQQLEKTEQIVITQSIRDTPPLERAPPRPTQQQQLDNKSSPDLNKGAIKKTIIQQEQQLNKSKKTTESAAAAGDLLMQQRDKSPLLERGRRYPRGNRPFEDEEILLGQNYPKTGNNLQNPNLSGSIGVIEAKEIIFDLQNIPPLPPTPPTPPPLPIQKNKLSSQNNNNNNNINNSDSGDNNNNKSIEFSVGKIVRSQPVSQLNIKDSQQPDSILLPSGNSLTPKRNINNINKEKLKKYHSSGEINSEEEAEEREQLIIDSVNRDSYLSGISEYSLDSELIAAQQKEELVVMPAFGDLTMDNEVAPIMTSSGDKREHLYKILIIGELGTGKTSFIKRYVHKFFSQNYRATIGVDFALKVLHWDQSTIIRLQLWDIAGQERFGNMTRVYYKDAVGAFIVFDVTRSGTFECVSKWKEDLDSKVQLPDGSPIPCILLANKCDQEKQGVVTNLDKMDEYVKENGFAGWFETSAKENINIDEAARALVNKILLNDKLISAGDLDGDKIDIGGSSGYNGSNGKKKDCSC